MAYTVDRFKIFTRFLKEENIYNNYMSISRNNLNKILTSAKMTFYISTAYEVKGWSWEDSVDGKRFWYMIHLKWIINLYNLCSNPNSSSILEIGTMNDILDIINHNAFVIKYNDYDFEDDLITQLKKIRDENQHK